MEEVRFDIKSQRLILASRCYSILDIAANLWPSQLLHFFDKYSLQTYLFPSVLMYANGRSRDAEVFSGSDPLEISAAKAGGKSLIVPKLSGLSGLILVPTQIIRTHVMLKEVHHIY